MGGDVRLKTVHEPLELRPAAKGVQLRVVRRDSREPASSPRHMRENELKTFLGGIRLAYNGIGASRIVTHRVGFRIERAYYALMPAVGGASLVTWHGLPSILAAAATTLSTIGRMQSNEVVLRILLLASTPCWTAHDLAVGSLPGLAADLLSMATGATMLFRGSTPIATVVTAARRFL